MATRGPFWKALAVFFGALFGGLLAMRLHGESFKTSHVLRRSPPSHMQSSPAQRLAQTARHISEPDTGSHNMTTRVEEYVDGLPRPRGLIADKGVELLLWQTPNGHKAAIIMEEIKEAYGREYTFQAVPIAKNYQKEPWFTKVGPNGRIPVIVDHDRGHFAVFEGFAILTYMTRHYDPKHLFWFPEDNDLSECEQWMAWQHGGLGPMQGQANHFFRSAKYHVPYGIKRYVGETERLYGVLNTRLEGRDYIVGAGRGKYSIADIASFGWINTGLWSAMDVKKWPNIEAWVNRINERPAVKRALTLVGEPGNTSAAVKKRLVEDPKWAAEEKERLAKVDAAKEEFGYVYEAV